MRRTAHPGADTTSALLTAQNSIRPAEPVNSLESFKGAHTHDLQKWSILRAMKLGNKFFNNA
jgi:hypothetical protein